MKTLKRYEQKQQKGMDAGTASMLFILMLVVITLLTALFAHDCLAAEKPRDEKQAPLAINRWCDNIFAGVGGGANAILDNGTFGVGGVGIDAFAGKWFTPSCAARIGWHGLNNKATDTSNGWFAGDNAFSYNYLHIDWIWDILNTFHYSETRIVSPRIGVQAGAIFTACNGIKNQEFGCGPFAQVGFRVGKRIEVGFEATFILAREEAYRNAGKLVCFPSASATVAVKLGKTGFDRKERIVRETVEVVREIPCDHSKLLRQLDSLEALRAVKPEVEVKYIPGAEIIYFDLDKSEITRREKAHLEFLLGHLPEGAKLCLVGHADKETGNPRHNMGLSERRVKTVAKQLKDWGFPAESIQTDFRGDTNNLSYTWDQAPKNRCVIITVVLE